MIDCLSDLFEKYQTFIVGIIGFAGVAITIWMNAKILRDQHRREIEHKTDSLRVSLFTELSILLDSYKLRIEQFNDMKGRSALLKEYVTNQVYIEMIPQLGLLTKLEIEKVMTAYLLNDQLLFRLGIYTGEWELSQERGFIRVMPEKAKVVAQTYSSSLVTIESALQVLKEHIR